MIGLRIRLFTHTHLHRQLAVCRSRQIPSFSITEVCYLYALHDTFPFRIHAQSGVVRK